MIVLGHMLERPPFGDAEIYVGAYVAGLLVLAAGTRLLARRLARHATRRLAVGAAVLMAVLAGLALREDYHISRAETCLRYLHGAVERGDAFGALSAYGRDGGRLVRIGPGHILTRYGTPPELVAFLRAKYGGWFSGSIAGLRNGLFGLARPTAAELEAVEHMRIPPGVEEQLIRMGNAPWPAADAAVQGSLPDGP